MLKILDRDYSNLTPMQPKYNAMCVFDMEAAKIAFNYAMDDFVFVLCEKNNTFTKCFNLMEVERFIEERCKI